MTGLQAKTIPADATTASAPYGTVMRWHGPGRNAALSFMLAMALVSASALFAHGGMLEEAYAGSSGSADSELLLINGDYHMLEIATSPAILSGDEEHVAMTISLMNVDAEPAVPVSGVEYGMTFVDGSDRDVTLASFDAYSPSESLSILIRPSTDAPFEVSGESAMEGSWLASGDSPATLKAPVFLEGGIVYIHATVKSIDSQPVSADGGSTFEVMFSMGQYVPFTVEIDGMPSDITFATYFDRVDKFSYDEKSRSVSVEMPFVWTEEYIEAASFIHAEFFIPKSIDLFENHDILLAVNGMDYFGTVDRSGSDETVVHYLLSSGKLLEMMQVLEPEYMDRMVFEIRAGAERQHQISGDASIESGDAVITRSAGGADGNYDVRVSAEPAGMLHPGNELTLSLEIRHEGSDDHIPGATYDVRLSLGGNVVLSEAGREAPEGGDRITATFDETGIATLEVANIEGTASSAKISFVISEPHDMSAMGGGGMSSHGSMDMGKDAGDHGSMDMGKDAGDHGSMAGMGDAEMMGHSEMMTEHGKLLSAHDSMMEEHRNMMTMMAEDDTMAEHSGMMMAHNEKMMAHDSMVASHYGMMLMMEESGMVPEDKAEKHATMMEEFTAMVKEHATMMKEHNAMVEKHNEMLGMEGSMDMAGMGDAEMMGHSEMMTEHGKLLSAHDSMMEEHRNMMTMMAEDDTMAEHSGMMMAHNEKMMAHDSMVASHYGMMLMMEESDMVPEDKADAYATMMEEFTAMVKEHSAMMKEHNAMVEKHNEMLGMEEAQAERDDPADLGSSSGDDAGQDSEPDGAAAGDGGGCLIATAAFGSELAPQVQQLRELRDNTVLATASGTAFMSGFNSIYYAFSPSVADIQRENPAIREATQVLLTPMLSSLSLLEHAGIDTESEMIGYGISVILLNLGMYVGIPAFAAVGCARLVRAKLRPRAETRPGQ